MSTPLSKFFYIGFITLAAIAILIGIVKLEKKNLRQQTLETSTTTPSYVYVVGYYMKRVGTAPVTKSDIVETTKRLETIADLKEFFTSIAQTMTDLEDFQVLSVDEFKQ